METSGEYIKNILWTVKISTSGLAIVCMLHCFSRQRRTIGSFSATAGLLILIGIH